MATSGKTENWWWGTGEKHSICIVCYLMFVSKLFNALNNFLENTLLSRMLNLPTT